MQTLLQTLLAQPKFTGLTDDAAAKLVNQTTVSQPVTTFGSFRTLAVLLTAVEYNTLRATLDAAVAADPTNYLLSDMKLAMLTPGGSDGSGGGLNFADPLFITQLTALCNAAGTACAGIPAKVAAYASKFTLWTKVNNAGKAVTALQVNQARAT